MRKAVLLAAVIPVLFLTATASAAVTTAPKISFAFAQSKVTHNAKLHFSYSSSALPSGTRLALQWRVGSRHVWRNVKWLTGRSGSGTARGVPIGSYLYRVALERSGSELAASRDKSLYSYGPVSYLTVCTAAGWDCNPGTVQIGTMVFSYAEEAEFPAQYPSYSPALTMTEATSCRSLTVEFATNDQQSGDEAYLQIAQTRSNAQYAQTAINTIGKATFSLDGGPFDLNVSETEGDNTFLNGSANCYTRSGLR